MWAAKFTSDLYYQRLLGLETLNNMVWAVTIMEKELLIRLITCELHMHIYVDAYSATLDVKYFMTTINSVVLIPINY